MGEGQDVVALRAINAATANGSWVRYLIYIHIYINVYMYIYIYLYICT
jgi:hypothetical protein